MEVSMQQVGFFRYCTPIHINVKYGKQPIYCTHISITIAHPLAE